MAEMLPTSPIENLSDPIGTGDIDMERERYAFDRAVDMSRLATERRSEIREENSQNEENKNNVFNRILELASPEGMEEYKKIDRIRRLNQYYGKQGCLNWNRRLAEQSATGRLSWKEEAIERLKKIGIKTGITGGLSLAIAGILAGGIAVVGSPIVWAGIAGAGVGRAAYEGYRMLKGEERETIADIERVNEAALDRVNKMIADLALLRDDIREKNPLFSEAQIEDSPEYKKQLFEIIDILNDDSKRKVKYVSDDSGTRYEAVGATETGEDIISVGELQKDLLREEHKQELGADVSAIVGSLGASIGLKILKGAEMATKAGQEAAKRILEHADKTPVGPYDFDKLATPDSSFMHNVQVSAQPFFDKITHIWHDTYSNLFGAIAKEEAAKVAYAQIKEIFAVGFAALWNTVWSTEGGRQSEWRIKENESGQKAKTEADKKIFGGPEPPTPSGPGETGGRTEIRTEQYMPEGQVINISQDANDRREMHIPKQFDKYEYFYITQYKIDPTNGKVYAEIRPLIPNGDGSFSKVVGGGAAPVEGKYFGLIPDERVLEIGEYADEPMGESSQETPDEDKTEDKEKKEYTDEEIEVTRRAAEITLSKIADYDELNAETEEEGHKKFIERSRALWKDFAVHGKFKVKDGKVVLDGRSDLDGNAAIDLLKMGKFDTSNVKYISQGSFLPKHINIDTGGEEGIVSGYDSKRFEDPETAFIDHHSPESKNTSSATLWMYKALILHGFINEGEHPGLSKAVEFITQLDNKTFPDYWKYYDTGYNKLIGLARFANLETIAKFFADGRDPTEELSDEDLMRYGFIQKQIKRKADGSPEKDEFNQNITVTVNRSQEQKKSIEASNKKIAEIQSDGFYIESPRFGKILIDVGSQVPGRFDAAIARGFGGYVLWNPRSNSFFISTKEPLPPDFKLDQGQQQRETMWIKPMSNEKKLRIHLSDIINAFTEGQDFTPSAKLATYLARDGRRRVGPSENDESTEADVISEEETEEELEFADNFNAGAKWVPIGESGRTDLAYVLQKNNKEEKKQIDFSDFSEFKIVKSGGGVARYKGKRIDTIEDEIALIGISKDGEEEFIIVPARRFVEIARPAAIPDDEFDKSRYLDEANIYLDETASQKYWKDFPQEVVSKTKAEWLSEMEKALPFGQLTIKFDSRERGINLTKMLSAYRVLARENGYWLTLFDYDRDRRKATAEIRTMDEEDARTSSKPPEPPAPEPPAPEPPAPEPPAPEVLEEADGEQPVSEAAPTDNNVEASAVEEPAPVEETLTPEEPASVEEALPTEEPAQEEEKPKYVAETPAPPTQPRTIRIELESTGRGEEGKVAKRYIEEGQTWQFGQKKSKETKTVTKIEKHNGDFTINFDVGEPMYGNPLELSEKFNKAKKVKKENGTSAEEGKPEAEGLKLIETELRDGAERYPIKVGDAWQFVDKDDGSKSIFVLDIIEPKEGQVTLGFHDKLNSENKTEHTFTQEEWIKILKRFEKAEG